MKRVRKNATKKESRGEQSRGGKKNNAEKEWSLSDQEEKRKGKERISLLTV